MKQKSFVSNPVSPFTHIGNKDMLFSEVPVNLNGWKHYPDIVAKNTRMEQKIQTSSFVFIYLEKQRSSRLAQSKSSGSE